MASGWDKSPGPENDYTSRPWTRVQAVLLVVAVVGLFVGVSLLELR
ncbi:hypothetical protein [Ciceribacter azotifigens]